MFDNTIAIFGRLRVGLLSVAWVAALLQILTGDRFVWLVHIGLLAFVAFVALTLTRLRRDTVVILLVLVVVAWALFDHFPTDDEWIAGGRYVLIFTALLPTMALVRATASLMPSVHRAQQALAGLPESASTGGFHIAANIFGAVINTGALAILSAALPDDASEPQRRRAAEAALRGMVTAAAWSPFFVAFAIGQSFVGETAAWVAIAMGAVTSAVFALVSFRIFDRSFSFGQLKLALACLKPVLLRLSIVLGAVLSSALIFDFTAISAVVVVMPVLVLVQFARYPRQITPIMTEVDRSMKAIADDIMIIGSAMLIGFFALRTGAFTALVSSFYAGVIPGWFALTITPLAMMLFSVIGVHPVISSTALMAVFSGGHAAVEPALLMQAHLIGWGAGTMASVASLSVIMSTSLYRVPSRQLAFGPNLWSGFAYALVGGAVLSFINMAL